MAGATMKSERNITVTRSRKRARVSVAVSQVPRKSSVRLIASAAHLGNSYIALIAALRSPGRNATIICLNVHIPRIACHQCGSTWKKEKCPGGVVIRIWRFYSSKQRDFSQRVYCPPTDDDDGDGENERVWAAALTDIVAMT